MDVGNVDNGKAKTKAKESGRAKIQARTKTRKEQSASSTTRRNLKAITDVAASGAHAEHGRKTVLVEKANASQVLWMAQRAGQEASRPQLQ